MKKYPKWTCYIFFFNLFIYLFLAVLGLRFCARAFSSCGKRGPLFIAMRGPLTIAASRCGAQAPDAQAQQLWLTGPVAPRHVGSSQNQGSNPEPGLEPLSPALAGRFPTTAPPGKPLDLLHFNGRLVISHAQKVSNKF